MSRQYVYPARFVREGNGSVSVYFPDLEGCQTYHETLEGAFLMAKDALEGFVETLLEEDMTLPEPSDIEGLDPEGGTLMLVVAEVKNMKKQTRYVKKTLSIPHWLNVEAEKEHLNFSGVLQEALKERLADRG